MSGLFGTITRGCLNATRAVWLSGLGFLYPAACPLCGCEEIEDGDDFGSIPRFCAGCRAGLIEEIKNSCRRCGAPVGPFLTTDDGCIHCRADRFRFETVVTLGVYKDLLRRACINAKQPGGEPLAAGLADLFWKQQRAVFEQTEFDWIVPIPQHWSQRPGQTHNHAETIARVLSSRLEVDVGRHFLRKTRKTAAQASLPASRRRTNLRGAFQARGASVLAGAAVLLVDDVLTTGTTANEASKVLRKAGAERIIVAVLARGIGQT